MKFLIGWLLSFLLFLTGWHQAYADSASDAPKTTQLQVLASNRVEQRFTERWNALLRKDFTTAYGYESPAYRSKVTLAAYANSFSTDLTWKLFKLDKVKIEGEAKAVVTYDLGFVFKTDWDFVLESTSHQSEQWFFEEGEWWHLIEDNVFPHSV